MNFVPGQMQIAAIVLSLALPLLLFCYGRIAVLHGAGRLFRIGSTTVIGLFAITCIALPGPRDFGDLLSGALLLLTAIILCYVIWGLVAWGFTLTLLTALAKAEGPLTLEQWISIYMRGGNLDGFAHNRLHLLLGSGMVVSTGGHVAVTPFGMAIARLVWLVRFSTGLG